MSSEKRPAQGGYPSEERPWMKYWPETLLNMIQIPECTLNEYLRAKVPSEDSVAMHYYGNDIRWSTVFEESSKVARSLKELGFGENDRIPMYFRSVPEFVYLLLGAEQVGASLVCRDNELHENVHAAAQSGSKVIFGHNYLSQEETNAYMADTGIETIVLLDPLRSGDRNAMPDYVRNYLEDLYSAGRSSSPGIMDWEAFLALGADYQGPVDAPVNIHRPLYRSYTSGSTGPSKQVIHSAHTIISILAQINFFGAFAPKPTKWLVCQFPPALVGVLIGMILMPLTAGLELILDPFVAPEDIDLELMRYRPNHMPMVPMYLETIVHSERIPEDYDMSHLRSAGVGSDSYNNAQIEKAVAFLKAHNCEGRQSVDYGQSEAGTAMTMPMSPSPVRDGFVGVPLPLTVISIFEPGTDKELTYNQIGEICKTGPGNMLSYDDPQETAETLKTHADGKLWLHTGDVGYMNEDGELFVLGRGFTPRYGGGNLETLTLDNAIADAKIEGIQDHFFVIVPDEDHPDFFEPYLFVILDDGYQLKDVESRIYDSLKPHMQPVGIFTLESRPYFHFKTARRGMAHDIAASRK